MPGTARFIAAAVALITTMLSHSPASGNAIADCWLMDETKRMEAAEQGLCQDAFARTGDAGEPPAVAVPTAPIPAEKPQPPAKRIGRNRLPMAVASSGSSISASNSMESSRPSRPREFDFFGNLRRDLNSVMDLLADGSSGTRPARGQRSSVNER